MVYFLPSFSPILPPSPPSHPSSLPPLLLLTHPPSLSCFSLSTLVNYNVLDIIPSLTTNCISVWSPMCIRLLTSSLNSWRELYNTWGEMKFSKHTIYTHTKQAYTVLLSPSLPPLTYPLLPPPPFLTGSYATVTSLIPQTLSEHEYKVINMYTVVYMYTTVTWLSHDWHVTTMWLTWLSHDCHMTVTWLSHDYHVTHMTVTWLMRYSYIY